MTTTFRRSGVAISLALFAVLALVTPSEAASKGSQARHLRGTFSETSDGAGLGYDISGTAHLKVGPHGTTAKVKVNGLDPTKTYPAHLHNQPCSFTPVAGGHYQNVEGGQTTPPNELWLSSTDDATGPLVPNRRGTAHGDGAATWLARLTGPGSHAMSIAVHNPANLPVRIACADLT